MSDENQQIKAQRASKRYQYVVTAKAEVSSLVFEIQILNISKSGIQFASNVDIKNSSTVNITWADVDEGNFDTTFIIARKVDEFNKTTFQYCYGAKYLDTTPEMKEQLLKLIRRLKEHHLAQDKQDIEKITPEYLFQLIDEDVDFLKNTFFLGKEVQPHIKNLIQDIQDYERDSFPRDDEASKCIQSLTTHHFHFNLFLKAINVMALDKELQLKFLKYIQEEIGRTLRMETRVRVVSKDLAQEMITEEEKAALRKKISESDNRLFYTRLRLLQAVVEKFIPTESDPEEFKEILKKINKEHVRILKLIEYQKSNIETEGAKKPADPTKRKTRNSKPLFTFLSWKVYLTVIILLLGIKLVQLQSHKPESPTVIFVRELGIPVPIKSFYVNQTRLDLVTFDKAWKKLKHEQKKEVFEKIVLYLQSHKETPVVALFTEQGQLIKILYVTTEITDQFVNSSN